MYNKSLKNSFGNDEKFFFSFIFTHKYKYSHIIHTFCDIYIPYMHTLKEKMESF